MVDAPVLDKDRNNGGKSVGGNGGGGGGGSGGGGPGSAIATDTPFPRPAPVRRRRHYNAIIAGGGGKSAQPSRGCCSTTMTAGVATASSWSNDVAPTPSAEGGAAQVEAGPAIAAGLS